MYGYIYKTTNLLNGKIYIGKKKGEFTEKYKGSGKYLKNAINKYGIENFIVEIIEYCETLEEQNEKEKYWIAYYRNQNIEMYNIADGGDGGDIFSCLPKEQLQNIKDYISYCNKNGICGNKGKHLTEEHKQKLSAAHKGIKRTPEQIEKHRQSILGKPAWNKGLTKDDPRVAKYCRQPGIYKHSEEIRKKISRNCKGKRKNYEVSQETRLKISKAHLGRLLSEEHKEKLRKPKSEEHKKKLSEAHKGRIWINNGIIAKMVYKNELQNYLDLGYIKGKLSKGDVK